MSMPIPHPHRMITHHIHQVHIADGFADDCEELIHRWLKTDLLTYETFCEIWKSMQFDMLYYGRPSGAEMAELSEELIYIAKYYMVSNPDNFEEAVAGLFLVYALLNLQPYPRFASLRIVPDDVPAITQIETIARSTRRYDVLYILGSVLTHGPVQYQVEARERGMEASLRKYLDGTTGIDRLGVRPKGVFYRQNEELDLLRELNNITRRYVEAKKNIPGTSQSLNYTNEKLAIELDSSLKGVINGILEEGDEGNKKISDHYSAVQAIKEKAMKQTVDAVKFLSSATEKNAEPTDSPSTSKSTGDTKRKTSPKRSSSSMKRRCAVRAQLYKNRLRKRRKKSKFSSSSDSNGSIDLSSDSNQSENEETQHSPRTSDDDGIEVVTNLNFEDLKGKSPKIVQEKEIDIEIERIPVLIRTEEDGSLYEIEIIDEMKDGATKNITDVSKAKTDSKDMAKLSKIKKGKGNSTKKKTDKVEEQTPKDKPLSLPSIDMGNDN